jgi:hypothetical protein
METWSVRSLIKNCFFFKNKQTATVVSVATVVAIELGHEIELRVSRHWHFVAADGWWR